MKIFRALGIDLGTTNCAAAMLSPSGHEFFLWEDKFRRKTYPSILAWDPQKETVVSGWDAWNRRVLTPRPLTSVKRKMGQRTELELGPLRFTPEDVGARILSDLVGLAADHFSPMVEDGALVMTQAVITVPAYFDAPQIAATRVAGEQAGLEVLSLVQEPTAAAMYHAWKRSITNATFLVYDLGGGTFDVSVIRSVEGEYQVLAIDGDNFLGGDDLDRRLAAHFVEHLVSQGYALENLDAHDSQDQARLLLLERVAQQTKEELSQSPVQYIARRDLFEDRKGQPVTLELEVSREEFETMVTDLVEDTLRCCEAALAQSKETANIGREEINYVLLVGGSTRVPLVRQKVQQAFPDAVFIADEPDTAVALGAAIQAANLGGLVIEDENQARMRMLSPCYTFQPQLTLVGELEVEDDIKRIESAVLFNLAGDVVSIVRTAQGETGVIEFEFQDVDLVDCGTHPMRMEFCDAEGEEVVGFPLDLHRGTIEEGERPTGAGLSSPSVLAKDIYLETVRDGKSQREVLVEKGTALPVKKDWTFRTADRSGAVVLRLFQNRYPIRTIHLTTPDCPVGTPVELEIEIDESMSVIASGEVAGQRFWAQIEPPPPGDLRGWDEIERMLDETESIAIGLWGHEATIFHDETAKVVRGIREAARNDPDKLQALVLRLEDVLEEFRSRGSVRLTPAWSRFETLIDGIRRQTFRQGNAPRFGLSLAEWQARIEEMIQRGKQAYEQGDQSAWTESFGQAQATWESLAQEDFRHRALDHRQHMEQLLSTCMHLMGEVLTDLGEYPFSSDPETRQLQEEEAGAIHVELGVVEASLHAPDPDVRKRIAQLERLLEKLAQLRKRVDRIATLGLVSR